MRKSAEQLDLFAERWLPVVGYEGHYEVSDCGRVRSVARVLTRMSKYGMPHPYPLRERIRSPSQHKGGYQLVQLFLNGVGTGYTIHELVLTAFRGPRPPGHEGAHENGKPSDNRLANLSWKTPLANTRQKNDHGTMLRGAANPSSKLHEADVAILKRMPHLFEQKEWAAMLGTCQSNISQILRGKTYAHVPPIGKITNGRHLRRDRHSAFTRRIPEAVPDLAASS